MGRAGFIVAFALAAGCGSGDDGGDAPFDPPGTGGVEGYVLEGGVLAASPAADALGGAHVSIVGGEADDVTAADGSFRLEAVPPGSYQLRVDDRSFPITVFADAVVRVGDRTIAHADATATVDAMLEPSMLLDQIYVYSPPTPLPDGVVVASALGDDAGVLDPALDLTVAGEQWLYYVDPTPALRFQHPVQYIFVDAADGTVQVEDGTAWPLINGRHYYAPPIADGPPPDAIHVPTGPTHTSSAAFAQAQTDVVFSHVPGCPNPRLLVLAIAGADESAAEADVAAIEALYGQGPFPGIVVREEFHAGDGDLHPKDRVLEKFNTLCEMSTECDTMLIYSSAHGSQNGSIQLETDRIESNGAKSEYDVLVPSDLSFASCRACDWYLMQDHCYSGGWLNGVKPRLTPLTGRDAIVMTSADRTHPAGYYPTWSLERTGAVFTQTFVQAFASFHDVALAFDWTKHLLAIDDDANVRKQSPQFWKRPRARGETCVAPGTAYLELGTSLTAGADTLTAGMHIPMALVTGPIEQAPADGGCAGDHLHGSPLTIDGVGPFDDPDPSGCGFGRIYTQPP